MAGGWWELAESLPVEQRAVVQRHAADWYSITLSSLTTSVQSDIKAKLAKVPSGKAQLVVQFVKHHGEGQFTFTSEKCQFQLLSWGPPDALRINDLNWDVKNTNQKLWQLDNNGATRILADNVDVHSAKLVQTRGRGTVKLAHAAAGLVVTVNDPPDGADNYEFKLTFGGK